MSLVRDYVQRLVLMYNFQVANVEDVFFVGFLQKFFGLVAREWRNWQTR